MNETGGDISTFTFDSYLKYALELDKHIKNNSFPTLVQKRKKKNYFTRSAEATPSFQGLPLSLNKLKVKEEKEK